MRCCIACAHTYRGPLACPMCGEPVEPLPRASRFGPNIRNKRADGSRGPTTVVPVRLTVDELAGVDASAQPTESRSDTIRRLLLASNPTTTKVTP